MSAYLSLTNMTSEKDIEQFSELVRRIEEYASSGVYDPVKHKTIIEDIDKAEAVFDSIIDGYMDAKNMPSMRQTNEVSELQKRLHHVKHDLPTPLIEFKGSSRINKMPVAIYTLPT